MPAESARINKILGSRLATRIAMVATALTMLLILAVGGTSYMVTRGQIAQGIQSTLENNALILTNRFNSSVDSVVKTLSELKQNALIINSLMDSLTRDISLKPFLDDFSTVNGIPVEIMLTDFEGKPVAGKNFAIEQAHPWEVPVLENAKSFSAIEKDSAQIYLLFIVPVFYQGTVSPEGALINKIDITRLVSELVDMNGIDQVRLLQHGKALATYSTSPEHEKTEGFITKVNKLDDTGPFADLGLSIEVSSSPSAMKAALDGISLFYGLLGLGILSVVVILSIFAGNYLARPINELEKVAESVVASGTFDHRFIVGGYAEVTRLGHAFNQMLKSLGSANKQLAEIAHKDDLTGLANRAFFQICLRSALQDSQRSGKLLGILLLDLDKFKDINDTLGHPTGDALLKKVAHRLSKLVRATDTVARLGGDEFVIIATHLNKANDAAVLGQGILDSLNRPFKLVDTEIHVSASIGIAISKPEADDPDRLLSNADLALYKAKEEGRGNYQFFDPLLNTVAQERKKLEISLRTALENSDFVLYYQPKIDLLSGCVTGVEALVRWKNGNGISYPGDFIKVAEDSGIIVHLGEWIFREACKQKAEWDKSSLKSLTVAINLSAVQLRQDETVERLLQVIRDSGVDPLDLQIEITESALMAKSDSVVQRLSSFRDIGVSLAIDDIGTGYSSLSNLKLLDVDVLKIDRSFIRDIEVDPNDAAITRAIIQLGHSLDLTVVAEGVETSGQANFLKHYGCHQSQGYFYSKPIDKNDFADWIEKKLNADVSIGARRPLWIPKEGTH